MEKNLLALSANDELERLASVLENISKDEMIEMVERSLTTGDQNFIKLLMALIKGLRSQPKTTPSQTFASSQSSLLLGTKMTCLFMTCVEFLAHHDLSIKVATELVRLLIVEMDVLSALFLVKLSSTIIAYLRNPKIESYRFLELLPKLLHLVGTKYSVPTETGSVGGKEFQSSVINSICLINWNSSSVVHLASVFKEIHLSVDELQPVILKFIKAMHDVDVQEIPPLVYQLLILSSKGCKNLLLDGIIRYFNGEGQGEPERNEDARTIIEDIDMLENTASSQPPATTAPSRNQQIESTVIYHVTFSIKQNQELGKEFIKYLKAHQHSGKREMLSSFVISLALSISKISVFESQVLDLLKHVVTYCFKDQRKKSESKWMQENSAPSYDVTGHVMASVKQMLVEWDIVMEGLVSFAFSLMEVSANKSCFGKPASSSGSFQSPTPAHHLNLLGTTILEEGSKVHSNVAVEIVNQLINRIITKSRDQVPCHFSDLLISLLKNSPHTYVDNSTKFRDMFNYFSFLPLATTRLLVEAMLPVVRISPPLKNALVIFLRKSLFSRKIEMRKMAVSGFLLLLKNFKVLTGFSNSQSQGSSSQVAADVHRNNKLNSIDNKSLCLEIINSLRRCFEQQHEVRVLLYYGLCDVAACNPVLLGPIADLLLNQLKNCFDSNEANLPPLKIFNCISLNSDTWKPLEPIPDLIKSLIGCLFHLKNKASRDDEEEAFLKRADAVLASSVTRLVKSDTEDFELDKDVGFDGNTVAGGRNVSLAQLIVEVYEVFLQRAVVHENVDQESIETMLNLFEGLNRIVDATRQVEPNKKTKAKKSNSSSEIQRSSPCVLGRHFSLDFIIKVTRTMFNGDDDISNLILSKINFCNYFFNSATTSLQQFAASNSSTDDFQFKFCSYAVGQYDLITSDLCDLGRLLLKRYIKVVIKPHSNDITIPASATNNANKNTPNTTKAFNSHCLKFFYQILLLFSQRWPNKMTEFLICLDVMNKSNKKIIEKDLTEGPVLYIKIFQRIFFTLLTSDGESHNNKDCLTTMQCLAIMIGHCQRETVLSECCDWLTRLFKEHIIEDSELLKLMLKQLLSLLRRTEMNLNFIKEVCKDIHLCLGDINQEVELDKSSNLPTVNHRSSVVIIQSVLSHLELEIEDSDWWIERTKNQLICDSFSNSSLPTNDSEEEEVSPLGKAKGRLGLDQPIKDRCKSLVVRTSSMTDILHDLVQTSIPFGPTVELMFKILNKFYLLLTSLVKLYLRNYSDKGKKNDISVKGPYERLIKHSATQLTNFIYPMITHVEKVESEKLQAENEKHKNKKKKNATVEKVKRMKETKLVPSLILSLEQYERLLIQLSKKSKVNLMLHFKVSTSRDFRINNATLQGILESHGNDSDYGSDGDDDDVSRRSGTNSVATANDNDDDGDVEEEIASMVKSEDEDEVHDGSSDIGHGDVEDCEMSAPARKRAKLSDVLPQAKGMANRRMLSRKNRN